MKLSNLVENSQFPSVEELLYTIWLTNQRIYETLLLILGNQNRESMDQLLNNHEQFKLEVGPLPFKVDD